MLCLRRVRVARVRRVDPKGVITTLAGNGSSGEISSGGAAAAAGIGYVDSVQVAADGTVYLASGQIRAVSPGLPAPPDPQTITVRVVVPASPVLLAGARLAVKRSRVRSVRLPVAVSLGSYPLACRSAERDPSFVYHRLPSPT